MKYILFDLDGTLTDPKIGITKSVNYALEKLGVKVDSLDDLVGFIGPPLKNSFMDFYRFSEEKSNEAIKYYREYFSVKGLYENSIYSGISELLAKLKSLDKTLIVATSKPTVFAKKILEHFNILEYFSFVAGSELDGTRTDKAEVIAYALLKNNITDLDCTIMIGDRKHDVIGAKKVGVTSIGVLYGYGDAEEIKGANADFIVNDILGLEELLIK